MDWTNQTCKQLAERAAWRAHLEPKKKKAASHKPQAASAPKEIGFKNFKYYLKKRLETNTIKRYK